MNRLDKEPPGRPGGAADDPTAVGVPSLSEEVLERLAELRALAEAGYMPLAEYLRAVEDARKELAGHSVNDWARRDS